MGGVRAGDERRLLLGGSASPGADRARARFPLKASVGGQMAADTSIRQKQSWAIHYSAYAGLPAA
jgi:hypothetical protein